MFPLYADIGLKEDIKFSYKKGVKYYQINQKIILILQIFFTELRKRKIKKIIENNENK